MKKSLLTMAMISFMATCAGATSFTSGLYTYTATSDSTVEVTSAASKDADGNTVTAHEVPATVQDADGKTYSVTTIGEGAFKYSKAVSIVLPESIDSIKSQAFSSASSLVSLTLPSNLKFIGYYSLSSTALTSIEIPASVETIDDGAFFTCNNLSSIKFNNGLKKIGKSVFYKCPVTTVTLPESLEELGKNAFMQCTKLASIKLPSTLVSLGSGVFYKCTSLTSIDIPESVTSIGDECFLYCDALSKVSLPASVATLGTSVFAATGIEEFTLASGNNNFTLVDGVLYSADKRLLYACPMKGKSTVTVDSKCVGINGGAFWGSEIKKVVLPDGFLAIDDYAFCMSSLAEINLPSSMTFIGEQGFASTKLSSIVLPENMTEVADGVLAGCTELTSVTIPSAVKTIYNHAFHNDTKLTSVTCLGTTAPEFDDVFDTYDSPFYNVSTSTPLYVPKGSAASYKSAGWGSYLTITEQENSVVGYVGATPADGTAFSTYLYMTVEVEFDADVTIVNSKPEVFIRKGSEESGAIKAPYDGWHATATSNNKVVRIWGDDGDGSVDYFKPEADTEYYLIIPAGIVKNEAGDLNERIVIKWNGPTTPKVVSLVSATPADGTVLDKYGNMTVELKFGADVTIANASPAVSLLKGDKTMGDKITPASGWHVTAASDNASVRVWGDDGDGGVDYFKTEEGAEYYLTIPAGIVKDANGYANEEITLKWNGPEAKKALTVVSTSPADGSTFDKTWADMAFNITFNDDITILDYGPDAVLREGDATTGTKVEPDLYWKAVKEDSKTLRIWGSDYDYAVQTFQPKEGVKYYMTIPAGIVQNESGSKNEQIVIMVNGPEAAKAGLTVVGTTPADGSSIDPGYQDMKLYVTFSEDITVVKTAPAVVMRKNDATTGSIVEPMGYWRAQRSGTTKLYIWGDDGDGYTDTYNVEDGVMYYVTIPAGVVKNSAGTLNDEIVFEFCGASTSGINGISAENGAVEVARYDINGRRVGENHKGMTVVRFSDGTVSKLFVK
jgi:hypothetical protein